MLDTPCLPTERLQLWTAPVANPLPKVIQTDQQRHERQRDECQDAVSPAQA